MDFDDVVRFHGHACPGLALGYRVAKLALEKLGGRAEDEELVAVVENNSCAVDAIQVMLGCTFGKGNFIFKDYGKHVYTIMSRPSGDGLRIAVNWEPSKESAAEKEAWQKYSAGDRSEQVRQVVHRRKAKKLQDVLAAEDDVLLSISDPVESLPAPARIHASIACARCGEKVMATRIRERGGRQFCIPCAGLEDK